MATRSLCVPRVIRTQDNFIRTYSGRKFWPLAPRVEDIDIHDIAHSLSLVCRWTGHTYCFYSVAEHSLRVSLLAQQLILNQSTSRSSNVITLAREVALSGLLHDASEAYLCDMPSPLKHAPGMGHLYQGYEARLMWAISVRFDLMPHMPSVVKDADRMMLNTEARDLMDVEEADADEWRVSGKRLPETIFPMDPRYAEVEFLRRFEALTQARKAGQVVNSL